MECEMCGNNDKLKKTRIEGAVLKVCSDCQDTGKVLRSSSSGRSDSKRKQRKKKGKKKPRAQKKQLDPDFDEKVKEAREDKGWSMEKLADLMNEKESVVKRVESGDLKPDKKLAGKMKKHLGVKLYKRRSGIGYGHSDGGSSGGKATIGDVAEVKKKD